MKQQATQLQAYQLLHEGILALSRAEDQGMRIDMDYLNRKQKQLTRKIKRLEKKLAESNFVKDWKKIYGGKYNYNSAPQLKYMLYNHYKLTPPKKTAKGHGSTAEESLKQLDMPELNWILQIRKLQKVKETYLNNFANEQIDGFMHPFFNLHTVRTYRSSSSAPNFQNIPKRDKEAMNITRRAIYPRPGHQLVEFDFSKLEVSIAACYHQDPTMIKYLTGKHNDMHGDLAQQIFMIDSFDKRISEHSLLREAAKNGFIFPQFYGDWFKGNAEGLCKWVDLPQTRWKPNMGIKLPDGTPIAKHLINKGIREFGVINQGTKKPTGFLKHLKEIEDDFWNNRFPVYQRWKKKWVKRYRRKGYFDMKTGFRCKGEMRRNEVINYPVQGAAFHCLLWSFIELDKLIQKEKWKSKLIGQIHDAIIMDIHPDELEYVANKVYEVTTQRLPEAWGWINVPLQIEAEICPVDGSWAEKEDWEWFNKFND